jgi:alcohol dehydrogenase (NADP+)
MVLFHFLDVAVIPKTTNLDRAKENFDSLKVELDEGDMEKISNLDANERVYDPKNWDSWNNLPVFA